MMITDHCCGAIRAGASAKKEMRGAGIGDFHNLRRKNRWAMARAEAKADSASEKDATNVPCAGSKGMCGNSRA